MTFSRAHLVLFSRNRRLGIVPLEAMAAGVPVVACEGGALETVSIEPPRETVFYDSLRRIQSKRRLRSKGWEEGKFAEHTGTWRRHSVSAL